MATRSYITLEIPKEWMGKVVKFDPTKLKQKLADIDNRGSITDIVNVEEVTLNHKYLTIYQHWDSYLLVDLLPKAFNDFETILNVMLLGDCSYITEEVIAPYICRGEGLGTSWEEVKPSQCDNILDIPTEEYNFLFRNGVWEQIVHTYEV